MILLAALTVFSSGTDGYHTYRIPALLKSSQGNLLAVVEARASQADAASNTLVGKISDDEGQSWSPQRLICAPGKEGGSFNNPTLVEVKKGHIIMHFQHYPAGTHEYDVVAGISGPKVVRGFQIESKDGGKTWGTPRDITPQIKPPEAVTIASGPGVGIRLKRGRLIMPYNFRVGSKWWVYCALSDNGGKTWRRGATVEEPDEMNANEVQVVELASGDVLINARNQGKKRARCIALSHDGGETFSRANYDDRLIDPICQGSMIRLKSGQLAFCNAMDVLKRQNGGIRFSDDEGRTWPRRALITEGSFQYSSMVELADGSIGVLYETVEDGNYQIKFERVRVP